MPVMPRAAARTADDDPVAAAKARCRAAHAQARKAEPLQAVRYDAIWSHVLLAADNQPDTIAAAMFTRIAILFEIATDRLGWPDVVRGLITAPRAGR
jgi:hypothetical protein